MKFSWDKVNNNLKNSSCLKVHDLANISIISSSLLFQKLLKLGEVLKTTNIEPAGIWTPKWIITWKIPVVSKFMTLQTSQCYPATYNYWASLNMNFSWDSLNVNHIRFICYNFNPFSISTSVVQLVEAWLEDWKVMGSNPFKPLINNVE